MSEDTASNNDNICIPEDAFEQFQAVSMIEEEELITLSDIVSPPPQALGPADDIDTLPYDNEVVLTSNYGYVPDLVNFEAFTGGEPNSTPTPINSEQTVETNARVASPQSVPKKKRGRKKKSETVLPSQPSNVGEENILDESSKKDNDTSLTPKLQGAKRGRKRNSDLINNGTAPASSKVEHSVPTEDLPKLRGRKRKTLEDTYETATPCDNSIVSPQISNSNGSLNKRGRKPKKPSLPLTDVPTQDNNVGQAVETKKKTTKRKKKKEDEMAPETYLAGLDNSSVPDKDDDGDDLSLSQLKNTLANPDTNNLENSDLLDILESTSDEKAPIDQQTSMVTEPNSTDFTCEAETNQQSHNFDNNDANHNSVQNPAVNSSTEIPNESLLVEDTSKRPKRRKIKQPIHYENDSDEDPFANVELSDDDTKRKGKKYYSDDEYIPGKKDKKGKRDISSSDSFDSDIDDLDGSRRVKNKRFSKKSDNTSISKSPRKGSKKTEPDVTTIVPNLDQDDDIEVCLQTSVIKASDNPALDVPSSWKNTNEFENFIANKTKGTGLKIKKVTAKEPSTTLEIPMIDPNEAKKTYAKSTQTTNITTKAIAVQATGLAELPMKHNVSLTTEQTEKACEFLKGIVKTTSELGELMTQKSEDFIQKKINAEHVTDTFKMDYCIKKSFLLLKLAKHNLTQLEDDLSKQYNEFLKKNKLSCHREEEKTVSAKPKLADSDSDCEIVDVQPKPKEKPKFNAKTVFLNKELSIKIAKKPSDEPKPKKSEIKMPGSHTVWLNDSIMVKKVKPTQSFLAQDSRNKKPPDSSITEQMVSNFFAIYNRQRALSICTPLVSKEWLCVHNDVMCNYFVVKPNNKYVASFSNDQLHAENPNNSVGSGDVMISDMTFQPKSLLTLSIQFLKKYLIVGQVQINGMNTNIVTKHSTESLMKLCLNILSNNQEVFKEKGDIDHMSLCQLNESHDSIESYDSVNSETECRSQVTGTLKSNTIETQQHQLQSLTKLCLNILTKDHSKLLEDRNDLDGFSLCQVSETLANKSDIRNLESTESTAFKSLSFIKKDITMDVEPLKGLCLKIVTELFSEVEANSHSLIEENMSPVIHIDNNHNMCSYVKPKVKNNAKTLKSLCVQSINTCLQLGLKTILLENETLVQPMCLKQITFQNIQKLLGSYLRIKQVKTLANICYEAVVLNHFDTYNNSPCGDSALTINCVNSMSEEAFLRLDESSLNMQGPVLYSDEDATNYDDDYDGYEDFNDEASPDRNMQTEENSWVAQLQMKELTSVSLPKISKSDANKELDKESNSDPIQMRIKLEPFEEYNESDATLPIIKAEPSNSFEDNMTVIPEAVVTKLERLESGAAESDPITCDINSFESFVRTNKMITGLEYSEDFDDIYSQSAERIRRQHQPDSDPENEVGELGLLVPQTFEPLNIETAKGTLMQSSSDESSTSNNKKSTSKKKLDKLKLKKGKKVPDPKLNKSVPLITTKQAEPPRINKLNKQKTTSNDNNEPSKELAILTRRMREKIRQEEKKVVSSDSDTETLSLKKRKDKKKSDKIEESAPKDPETSVHDEIQCSNVDSTENLVDNGETQTFSGFSALDQNEISSYHKYVKYVYDKIVPNETENNTTEKAEDSNNRVGSPVMKPDEPIELLECEPLMPIFDKNPPKSKTKKKLKTIEANRSVDDMYYKERHGWHCYSVNKNDVKLYSEPQIILEKLPESFVETYFRYQDMTDHCKDDEEVDRLINLQSLNRSAPTKEIKKNGNRKAKSVANDTSGVGDVSRPDSPNDDHFDELMPSDDDANVDDELPPAARQTTTENYLAKNSLMDDNESDSEKPNKTTEAMDETVTSNKQSKRLGAKLKTVKAENPEDLMLTADKMMNKELTLLHAPVVLDGNVAQAPRKGPSTRQKHKSKGESSHSHSKTKDDSSSEEEKQWVNTKEKLLKRMDHKNYQPSVDDAKRAKIVSEFIERRGEGFSRKGNISGRRKLSTKKFMERQKQLRVLSRELFGEAPGTAKNTGQSYFKGRRNIRKVLKKKSLARSTVIANMEEFERKRRLNMQQNKLREQLGCDEDVNVLVINDEVCLEYDFDEGQPIVSVHPFFTKVMKAHQYEGVKFMWDACFESLAMIEAGHGGGGCILAHCMGLGKTLQVLALLHTVLTHPRANMKRVLVCCPLSTVLNWVDEIHKWIGPVTDQIKVFELSKLKKTYERAYQLEDWYNGGGIFIIGYELFRNLTTLDPEIDDVRPTVNNKIRTALLDPGPDIIICDEGHLLKNDCSVLAVAMSRVVTKRRIILTGTPMQNNLREYYCMVNFVKPNLLGTYGEYSNRFENPIMNGQHRDSVTEDIKLMKARTHILHKVLEACLQRQEASVLYPYLPKKHEYTVFIPLTQCQIDMYKHYLDKYSRQTKQSILKDFHTLQKIWTHPQVLHHFLVKARDQKAAIKSEKLEDDLAHEDLAATEDIKPALTETWWLQYLEGGSKLESLESSNKFLAVFRILEECTALGDKVLIFSTSLFTMDVLEYFLRKINQWSLGQQYYRLDGSVPPEVRQKWCREFNAEHNLSTKLFLISTRAGSLGLNMTAANRVIILDTSWNPAHDIQSIFRVYRFGQKKDCYIYRLVALGTMEQKIYERSVTKQAVACRVVDEQLIDRHYNMAELTELYRFDEVGAGVAGGVAVGVHDVALLRVARDAQLHAVHEHDSLLRGSSEQELEEHERAAAWTQFQQEQTHKQIQNKLIPVSETKTDVKKSKQMQTEDTSEDYQLTESKSKKAKSKSKQEYILPSTEPDRSRLKPDDVVKSIEVEKDEIEPASTEKVKKRGTKTISCNIPIQTSETSSPLDPANEEDVVKKIMNILIKFDYHTSRSHTDIANLIKNVRQAVASGDMSNLSDRDEVAQSIAQVLIDKKPEHESNLLVPIADVPLSKRRGRPAKRHRGRPRKTEPMIPDKKLGSDTDSAPSEDIPKQKVYPSSKQKLQQQNQVISVPEENETILLSDDDEPIPGEIPTPTEPEKAKEVPKTPEKPIERVPLHPSLLTNKNFIQIVAHTYLKNNSSLDEDAAILAAQYSTYKALTEIKSTGVALDRGPIYDIAVEVLGIEVLKKLNSGDSGLNQNVLEASPELQTAVPANTATKVRVRKDHLMPQVRKELESHGFANISKRLDIMTASVGPPQVVKPDVVPVGLIKRGPAPMNESILPDDDDDVCITSDPIPSTSDLIPSTSNAIPPTPSSQISPAPNPVITVPVTAPVAKKPLLIRKTKPGPASKTILPLNMLTPAVTAPAPTVAPSAPPLVQAPAVGSRVYLSKPELGPKVAGIKVINNSFCIDPLPCTSAQNYTISLDSDDDDVITPAASQPVPTGLFMRAAPSMVIPLSMDNPGAPIPSRVQFNPEPQQPQSIAVTVKVDPNNPQPTNAKKLLKITKEEYEAVVKRRKEQSMNTTDPNGVNTIKLLNTKPYVQPKPGDIVQISNTGSIVILNKKLEEEAMKVKNNRAQEQVIDLEPDKKKTPVTSKPIPKPWRQSLGIKANRVARSGLIGQSNTPSASKQASSDKIHNEMGKSVISSKKNPMTSLQKTNAESPITKPVSTDRAYKRALSISSSSDSSRPNSPDDPLSILKDVVQIKAPEDNAKPKTAPQTKSLLRPNTPAVTETRKFMSIEQAKQIISKTSTNKPNTNQKPHGQNLQKNTNITMTKSKQSPVVAEWMKPKASRVDTSKLATSSNKPASQSKPLPAKPSGSTSTVVGNSKNILIGGKTTATHSNTTASRNSGGSAVRVTNVEKIVPASSDKKRSIRAPEPTVAKKKKSEPPKTLKDFNIDDFDDIIELE